MIIFENKPKFLNSAQNSTIIATAVYIYATLEAMPFHNSSSSNLEDSINLSHDSVKLDMNRNILQKKKAYAKGRRTKFNFHQY